MEYLYIHTQKRVRFFFLPPKTNFHPLGGDIPSAYDVVQEEINLLDVCVVIQAFQVPKAQHPGKDVLFQPQMPSSFWCL